jgi:hypothetical protein
MKKEVSLHTYQQENAGAWKRHLAIGVIVFLVFLSLPNFCGAHNHDDVS